MNLFFENSTRTRTTFEAAAKRLSANVLNIDIARSSTSKVRLYEIRFGTSKQWLPIFLLYVIHLQVLHISLLKMYVRKSQLLMPEMDVMPIQRKRCSICSLFAVRRKPFEDLSVAIIGDIKHSRVARSDVAALQTLGCKDIRVIAPNTLLPVGFSEYGDHVRLFNNMDEGITGCDVIIALRIQNERIDSPALSSQSEFYRMYGLNKERLSLAKPDCIVMHPGPMNRGVEIDSSIADGEQSVILKQVTNGIAVRMAVLALSMQGQLQEQGLIEAIAL